MRSGDPTEVPPNFWTIRPMPKPEKALNFIENSPVGEGQTRPPPLPGHLARSMLLHGYRQYWGGTGAPMKLLEMVTRGKSADARHEPAGILDHDRRHAKRRLAYESGRSMPKPVRHLLRLVHVERIDLSRVKKEDFEIIDHIKLHHRISTRACARRRASSAGFQALADTLRWPAGCLKDATRVAPREHREFWAADSRPRFFFLPSRLQPSAVTTCSEHWSWMCQSYR